MSCRCFNCSYLEMVANAKQESELYRIDACHEVKLCTISQLKRVARLLEARHTGHYETPLHLAAMNPNNYEIVKELISAGAEVQAGDWIDNTPLHTAVIHGNRKITEILLQSGANPNCVNLVRHTPLHLAVKSPLYQQKDSGFEFHDKHIVEILIQAGADVNCTTEFNETPLFRAVEIGDFGIVQILLTSGADTNINNINSVSGLHVALNQLQPNQKIIAELIKYGANINWKDKWSRNSLDLAVRRYFHDPSDKLATAKALIKISILVHPNDSINLYKIREETVLHSLHKFYKVCFTVVRQMIEYQLISDITLHDFALRGSNCRVLSCYKLEEKMYAKVLVALLKEKCGIYSDVVECHIPRLYLKEVITKIRIVAKDWTNTGGQPIGLTSEVVWLICDYLNRTDMLQLIKVSSIVESNYFMRE